MFSSGTDLLKTSPGAPIPAAVELLAKVEALPAVGTLYHDLVKNAKVPPSLHGCSEAGSRKSIFRCYWRYRSTDVAPTEPVSFVCQRQ